MNKLLILICLLLSAGNNKFVSAKEDYSLSNTGKAFASCAISNIVNPRNILSTSWIWSGFNTGICFYLKYGEEVSFMKETVQDTAKNTLLGSFSTIYTIADKVYNEVSGKIEESEESKHTGHSPYNADCPICKNVKEILVKEKSNSYNCKERWLNKDCELNGSDWRRTNSELHIA